MTTGIRQPNDFCWINILAPEPDAAREFFSKLLGWTYFEAVGMGGHIIQVNGSNVGGLWDLNSPQVPAGTPPVIGVMIKSAKLEDTGAKITAAGGKSMPAFDVAENGRMSVCFDPGGANFDLWQGNKDQGMEVDSETHGAPSWFELFTNDVEQAKEFYSTVFGWTSVGMPMPGMTYTIFSQGENGVAGMIQITPEMGKFPPHWTTYFTVSDIDAAVAHAVELGATIIVPKMNAPGVGDFSMITSPQNLTFYLIQYKR